MTTQQPRTLAELWQAAGQKPFDAVSKDGSYAVHIVAMTPRGSALGWSTSHRTEGSWPGDFADWHPAPAPKRYVYPALVQGHDGYMATVDLFATEDEARTVWPGKFVRLLTDRGVEV